MHRRGHRTEIELAEANPTDTAALESEVERLRLEQKRYVAAIASAPDVEELVKELQHRSQRIRAIDLELAATRRPFLQRRELLTKVDRMARRKLAALRDALTGDREGLGQVFRAFFSPGSLRFEPTAWLGRKVWKITGVAHLRPFTLESDPIGN
jgi:hypothetical protein